MRLFLMYRYRPWGTGDCLKRALEWDGHFVWTVDTRLFKLGGYDWKNFWEEIKGLNMDGMICVGLQDGFPSGFKAYGFPVVYWALTDPLCLAYNVNAAGAVDMVFVAQKKYLGLYERFAVRSEWLPLAYDSSYGAKKGYIHPYFIVESVGEQGIPEVDIDLAFVGGTYKNKHPQRSEWLDKLSSEFNVFRSSSTFMSDMFDVYRRSKMVYNYSVADDLNMRIFEVLGSGRLLVTNRISKDNGLAELFEEDTHYVAYDSYEELYDKVKFYSEHPLEREAIASAGYTKAYPNHTFIQRGRVLVDAIDKLNKTASEVKPSESSSE